MSDLLSLSASHPQRKKDCYSDQLHSAVLETPHACKHNYYFLPVIFGIALFTARKIGFTLSLLSANLVQKSAN